jgi:hypothetical protein
VVIERGRVASRRIVIHARNMMVSPLATFVWQVDEAGREIALLDVNLAHSRPGMPLLAQSGWQRRGPSEGSAMPQMMGFSHVDLTVSDCERAATWWQDVLGFTLVHQLVMERSR